MLRFIKASPFQQLPWLGLASLIASLLLLAILGVTRVAAAPPTPPHPLQGFGECAQCHGPGKSASPMPADHGAYSTETCAGCHSAAAPPAPAGAPAAAPAATAPAPTQACLSCHQNKDLSVQLSSGEQMSLYIEEGRFEQSVHGRRLACTDCHTTITSYPHPKVRYDSRRAYTTAYYESCKRCHFANYTKTLDSVHFTALSSGHSEAPVCTDCHGAHYVAKPAAPRRSISEACGACHTDVNRDYAASVHGRALVGEDNPDVPVCSTCHGVHSIPGATSASFRLASTQLCAGCHENPELAAKYGLSPNVAKTYFEDFHGRTVGFYQQQSSTAQPIEPLCVDCHGIHNIKSATEPDSPTMRTNLQATCQKCHTDASPNFPAAWLAHYEPSPDKAPLVYYIRMYYWVLIPMMIGGLVLHIGLDLWRLARNR